MYIPLSTILLILTAPLWAPLAMILVMALPAIIVAVLEGIWAARWYWLLASGCIFILCLYK